MFSSPHSGDFHNAKYPAAKPAAVAKAARVKALHIDKDQDKAGRFQNAWNKSAARLQKRDSPEEQALAIAVMLTEPDRRSGKSFLLPPSNQSLSPMRRPDPQLSQKVIKILQGVGPTDTACDPIVQSAAPVLNSQKTAAESAKYTPASHPRALNIWTERRADNHCITQVHLQFGSSEHIKLKLEPVADRSIRIEMDTNLNATIERFQRRRADLKRFFLNQGYHTVEITLTHTPEAKTLFSQSSHSIQAALAEDLSTKPQAVATTVALPFGPNDAAQRLTLSL